MLVFMTDTKVIRLDMDSYHILAVIKEKMNADKLKKRQAPNATFSDAVRATQKAKEATK
jgi:hypothetical protein